MMRDSQASACPVCAVREDHLASRFAVSQSEAPPRCRTGARGASIRHSPSIWVSEMATTITDCFGRVIRLTAERLAHILDHPEMRGMEAELERVLREPELVRRSLTDPAVAIFYAFYARTSVGGKWLCIVVKYLQDDAFVVTAYLTDKPKTGEQLWPTK